MGNWYDAVDSSDVAVRGEYLPWCTCDYDITVIKTSDHESQKGLGPQFILEMTVDKSGYPDVVPDGVTRSWVCTVGGKGSSGPGNIKAFLHGVLGVPIDQDLKAVTGYGVPEWLKAACGAENIFQGRKLRLRTTAIMTKGNAYKAPGPFTVHSFPVGALGGAMSPPVTEEASFGVQQQPQGDAFTPAPQWQQPAPAFNAQGFAPPQQGQPQMQPQMQPQGQPPQAPTMPQQGQPQGFPQMQPPKAPTMPQGFPQMQPQGQPQGFPQGQPQGFPQGFPQMQPQGQPQGFPQGQPQGFPQGQPQGQPQMQPQGFPQMQPQGQPQMQPQGQPQMQMPNQQGVPAGYTLLPNGSYFDAATNTIVPAGGR